MDLKLEVVPIPVKDVDTAKRFYTEQVGFRLDHDMAPQQGMRVVCARRYWRAECRSVRSSS